MAQTRQAMSMALGALGDPDGELLITTQAVPATTKRVALAQAIVSIDEDTGALLCASGDGTFEDLTVTGTLVATPDEITATATGVAASIATLNTEVTTDGGAAEDEVTLADGTSGQIKNIYCVAAGNAGDSYKITPATFAQGTKITFGADPTGKGCTLVWADSEGWIIVGNNGGTIA